MRNCQSTTILFLPNPVMWRSFLQRFQTAKLRQKQSETSCLRSHDRSRQSGRAKCIEWDHRHHHHQQQHHLVGGLNPSEKYESQLVWLETQYIYIPNESKARIIYVRYGKDGFLRKGGLFVMVTPPLEMHTISTLLSSLLPLQTLFTARFNLRLPLEDHCWQKYRPTKRCKKKNHFKLRSFVIFAFMLINRSFIIYIIQRDLCKGCAARATPLRAHMWHIAHKKVWNTVTRPLLKISAHTLGTKEILCQATFQVFHPIFITKAVVESKIFLPIPSIARHMDYHLST